MIPAAWRRSPRFAALLIVVLVTGGKAWLALQRRTDESEVSRDLADEPANADRLEASSTDW